MKRKLLLILLHFSLIPVVQAQPIWQWLKTGGGTTATNSIDMTYAIVKDTSKNLYSCGNFHGTNVPIGTTTYSSATKNGFVQKKNQNGAPIWQYITSCTGNVAIYNIALDTNENVIFCGQYSGTLTIGSTTLSPGIGTNSSFVCKLNGSTGLPIWAVAFKSAGDATSDIIATGLAAHPDGSLYVSGNFKGTGLTFNSSLTYGATMNNQGVLQLDGYVVHLTANGTTDWVRRVNASSSTNADKSIYDLTIDQDGNVVGVGYFRSGTLIMYPGNVTINNGNATGSVYDGFIAAWTKDGTNIGITAVGSTSGLQNDLLYDIIKLPNNNLAVCGTFNSVATVKIINPTNRTTIQTFQPTNGSNSNFYVLAADELNNIYTTGSISNPATFGTTTLSASGQQDIVLAKITNSNTWDWAIAYGNSSSSLTNDIGRSICILGENDIVTGGCFSSTLTLGNYSKTASGNGDFFEARYAPCTSGNIAASQPSNIVGCEGSEAGLTFTTSLPSSYQWYENNSLIAGATNSNYTFNLSLSDHQASFYCIATNGCGTVTSSSVTSTVYTATTISSFPTSQSICSGQNLNLNVNATGSNLTYQWYKNGNIISGANNPSYTINSLTTNDAGNYQIYINSPYCPTVYSTTATIFIHTPVSISTQPVSQIKCEGNQVSFSATATGSYTSFIWKKNGTTIPYTNSPTLILSNITSAHNANYTLTVTGHCNSVTSDTATLTVKQYTSIQSQINYVNACTNSGQTYSLYVNAIGSDNHYDWMKNGYPFYSTNLNYYEIDSVDLNDAGNYSVLVSGACNSVVSNPIAFVVYKSYKDTIQVTTCDTYTWNNQVYQQSGLYTKTLMSVGGCDSVVTLDLTLHNPSTQIYLQHDTLFSTSIGATQFEWIDCTTNQPIPNANGAYYKPTHTGNYGLHVWKGLCEVYSNCIAFNATSNIEENSLDQFKIYPNPTTGYVRVELNHPSSLNIIDIHGNLLVQLINQSEFLVDLTGLESGIYFIQDVNSGYTSRIIKE